MNAIRSEKLVRLAVPLFLFLAFPSAAPAAETEASGTVPRESHAFDLTLGAGRVAYEENVTIDPVDSDWDASTLRLGAAWTFDLSGRDRLRLRGYYWSSGEEEEEWTMGSAVVQRNRLQAQALDGRVEWGLDLVRRGESRSTAWFGLGYRAQDFDRSDFDLLRTMETFSGSVGEQYALGYLSAGVDGGFRVARALRAEGGVYLGWIYFNEADNDLVGTIEGDGGYFVEARAGLAWQAAPRHAFGLGVFYEFQSLDGAVERAFLPEEGVVEWPDNETVQAGVDVRWTFTP